MQRRTPHGKEKTELPTVKSQESWRVGHRLEADEAESLMIADLLNLSSVDTHDFSTPKFNLDRSQLEKIHHLVNFQQTELKLEVSEEYTSPSCARNENIESGMIECKSVGEMSDLTTLPDMTLSPRKTYVSRNPYFTLDGQPTMTGNIAPADVHTVKQGDFCRDVQDPQVQTLTKAMRNCFSSEENRLELSIETTKLKRSRRPNRSHNHVQVDASSPNSAKNQLGHVTSDSPNPNSLRRSRSRSSDKKSRVHDSPKASKAFKMGHGSIKLSPTAPLCGRENPHEKSLSSKNGTSKDQGFSLQHPDREDNCYYDFLATPVDVDLGFSSITSVPRSPFTPHTAANEGQCDALDLESVQNSVHSNIMRPSASRMRRDPSMDFSVHSLTGSHTGSDFGSVNSPFTIACPSPSYSQRSQSVLSCYANSINGSACGSAFQSPAITPSVSDASLPQLLTTNASAPPSVAIGPFPTSGWRSPRSLSSTSLALRLGPNYSVGTSQSHVVTPPSASSSTSVSSDHNILQTQSKLPSQLKKSHNSQTSLNSHSNLSAPHF